MKQLSGPYNSFEQYYPLEDAIELYNEIWYESSSSDEWADKNMKSGRELCKNGETNAFMHCN